MKNKILHILPVNTFTIPFVKFINKEFNSADHVFLFSSNPGEETLSSYTNIKFLTGRTFLKLNIIINVFTILKCMFGSRQIILHGLPPINYYILVPWLFKKSYWTIYGYEIYSNHQKENSFYEFKKKFILNRVAGHITHIKGDSDLANEKFKSKAKFYFSPIYLSNVVLHRNETYKEQSKNSNCFKVLLGNSASPTNCHSSILKLLEPFKNSNLMIFSPLSYGNYPTYRAGIIEEGKRIFGEKFIPITDFMERNEYENFLQDMDIAIFNHNRQEAMGLTISLLGMGKTIYMNKNTTSYKSLVLKGFKVFRNDIIEEDGLFVERDTSGNIELISKYYSYEILKESWGSIFNN